MQTDGRTLLFKEGASFGGIPEGYIPFFLVDALKHDKKKAHIFVAHSAKQAQTVYAQIKAIKKGIKVFHLPGWDCLPYDRVGPSQDIITKRIQTFIDLGVENDGYILIVDIHSFLQKVPPKDYWHDKTVSFKQGQAYSRDKVVDQLNTFGYKRCETVYAEGDYAVRGHIVDVFITGDDYPVRLDFFDTEIENIRAFSIDTQVTLPGKNNFLQVDLRPATEICWDETATENFKKNYINLESNMSLNIDELYQSVTHGRIFQGQEHWAPLAFNIPFCTIETYASLQGYNLYADQYIQDALKDSVDLLFDYYQARVNPFVGQVSFRPLPPDSFYRVQEKTTFIILTPFVKPNEKDYGARLLIDFPKRQGNPDFLENVLEYIIKASQKGSVHLACSSQGTKERIHELLQEHQFTQEIPTYIMPMEKGFYGKEFTLITDQDILGEPQRVTKIKKRSHQRFFQELNEMSVGDLIVHKDHGIGRYLGLESIHISDRPHDCIILEYDQGTRLYLPVENMELISRYGNETALTQLDRLGSATWKTKKGKAKKRIELIAHYLIETAAKRSKLVAEEIKIPEGAYANFCHQFPYVETNDQSEAIDDIIKDLSSGKPMDRLICGDVGFGKTEVALRAAFLAVSGGKQVAVITPTTLLCRQHTQTFMNRFQFEKYNIAQLSRLISPKNLKKVKLGLQEGSVDIVVGTHSLLGKEIVFKNLGLVIVDEEQHFGVNQKEKLKEKYPHLHVLTLTATPIPRTLQMSFTGVRDLSLITTPPVDRLPVRTFVLEEDATTIKEAILRELHRGGQIFYVCPHVKNQQGIEDMLKTILPDLRFKTVNGQMDAVQLEDTISAFCERHYDLLLATNIIESGIDMPSVNTIILHNSHLFGLAQLYQLRGRVGRAKVQAYAYFTIPKQRALTEQANKRLKVLQSLDSLGAGFHLANHDLDIRGSGNILGEEQTGHMKEIGVDLYQQLLQETILMIKAKESGETYQEDWTPQISLGCAVLIPEQYIQDLSVRLSLYKRLASFTEIEEIHAFAAELVDRFGKFPMEVKNLLQVSEIKMLSKKTHVEKIDVGPKGFLLSFFNNNFPNPVGLLKWLQSKQMNAHCKIRNDQKLFVQFDGDDIKKRYSICKKFLLHLKALI
jgi:transcription-repair coupling factor (superfamily II helicase)